MYWFTRLDNVNKFVDYLVIVGILAIIFIPVICHIHADFDEFETDDEVEQRKIKRVSWLKKLRWIVPVTGFFVLFKVFIPTQKDVIIIMAGGKTLDYVQSDSNLSKIPYKATAVIVEYLDKQLKDIKK